MESLSQYLLYKFLNAMELGKMFKTFKPRFYILLKTMQVYKSELLFGTVYVSLLRNLFLNENFRELSHLLKNCVFPEHANYNLLCKFLFYKSHYLARKGEILQALILVSECLRKAPDSEIWKEQNTVVKQEASPAIELEKPNVLIRRGVYHFRLMARKL